MALKILNRFALAAAAGGIWTIAALPQQAGSAEWYRASDEASGSNISFEADVTAKLSGGAVSVRDFDVPERIAPTVRMISQTAPAGDEQGALFANADEAARKTSNPLGGDFMVMINEWNFDFLDGDLTDKTADHLLGRAAGRFRLRQGCRNLRN
jgi:hypothetical protein